MRKTKIVCTLGPSTASPEMLRKLLEAGMDVARLNLSHGTYEEHTERLANLRKIAKELGRDLNLGVLLDIQGPKIRIGQIEGGKVEVNQGDQIILTTEPCVGDANKIFVGYEPLPRAMKPGSIIYIDDGLIELEVGDVRGKELICKVITGGEIGSRKGVTLPGVEIDLPAVTKEDIEHIRFGVRQGVDFIAASFVRRPEHVLEVRRVIEEAGGNIPIIAKIESDEGLRNIDDIIKVSDGIMVARGDLGVEIPSEEVPLAQKMLIKKCNEAGIPVITATQMLDSMIRNPRPTRAEVTDVANAILDGTDCVMLSGETAIGKYPVEAVKVMARIAIRIEKSIDYRAILNDMQSNRRQSIEESIALATCQTALDLDVKAIICSTQSGATARFIANHRPQAPILAVCPYENVIRQLSLSRGVYPILVGRPSTIDEMSDIAVEAAKAKGFVNSGDIVTITAGVKTSVPGSTNMLQVYQVD